MYLIIFLYSPHKCPDPKPRSSMCTNFAMRFSKNIHSRKLNQRLIHSRFCPTRNFHMDDEEAYFTCCEFLVSLFKTIYCIYIYIVIVIKFIILEPKSCCYRNIQWWNKSIQFIYFSRRIIIFSPRFIYYRLTMQ